MNAHHRPRTARQEAAQLRRVAAEDYRLPRLPAQYRFALVRDINQPRVKPLVFPEGLPALARSLHRMRAGRSIELHERRQRISGEHEARLGVVVWARDADRWAHQGLGWAWLDGGGLRELQDALDAADPDIGLHLARAS